MKLDPILSKEEFDKLLAGRRFGQERKGDEGKALQSGRVLKALMLHLVTGFSVREAAYQADRVSTTAIYAALGRLGLRKKKPKKSKAKVCCPYCKRPLNVSELREKSNAKSGRTSASR